MANVSKGDLAMSSIYQRITKKREANTLASRFDKWNSQEVELLAVAP